ncbi:hypothetical protein KP509_08G017300 [Ceratopteris richardii]|nr:hypothetical protein KP509_08G017300 [Ceratopteris richardii]
MVLEETVESDQIVSNTLLDFYCKCSSLDDARIVFDRMKMQDLVSWNAMLGGFAEHGSSANLQRCLEHMRQNGAAPDTITYLCILKSCARSDHPNRILELHMEIVKGGFDDVVNIENNLVHIYVKLGFIAEAWHVLRRQSPPSVVSWTSLIAGFVEYGMIEDAFQSFEVMKEYEVCPNDATFICILRICGIGADGIIKGRQIHAQIVKHGLEVQISVGNILIDMYFKCGSIVDAQNVFDNLHSLDVISWTTLLSGYAEHGLCEQAFTCLDQMQNGGVAPNSTSFLCALKACQSFYNFHKGLELHAEIILEEYEEDLFLGNMLIDFYVNSGLMIDAKEVFDHISARNVVSWNSLISGFADQGNVDTVKDLLKEMELEGISPTDTTFLCSLKVCNKDSLSLGQEIHIWITKKGYDSENFLKNSLVDMYSKCGLLLETHTVFHSQGGCDIISWNSLMGGYNDAGLHSEVLHALEKMLLEGITPNVPTFFTVLKACKNIGLINRGYEAHILVIKMGFEKDTFVASALVDMYATQGKFEDAELILSWQGVQTAVIWTALIVGYTEHGFPEQVIECYRKMQEASIPADETLFICLLKACGNVGAIVMGCELYNDIVKKGLLEGKMAFSGSMNGEAASGKEQEFSRIMEDANVLSLRNVLIDMFCRCGSLADAHKVFDAVPLKDLVAWNALISGYALVGKSKPMALLLEKMKSQNIQPDEVTYASILTACSHVGFNDTAHVYFEEMMHVYGLLQSRQHFNCIVDLLTRAGQLDEAFAVVEKFPFQPDLVTWMVVLDGCQKSGNIKLGRYAFECLRSLENELPAFTPMSSIYVNPQICKGIKELEKNHVSCRNRMRYDTKCNVFAECG